MTAALDPLSAAEIEAAVTAVRATGQVLYDWDTATGRNIVWSVALGNETYGRPVVAGDAVYVPPGVLHSTGEGVFLVEVQEP